MQRLFSLQEGASIETLAGEKCISQIILLEVISLLKNQLIIQFNYNLSS